VNLKYSALDLSFYEVHSPTRPQHIGALISFEQEYPVSKLEHNLARIPSEYPTLLYRTNVLGRSNIAPPFFKSLDILEPISRFVAKRMMSEDFYKDRMWEILHLRSPESGQTYILFKLHHSLADGVSGLNFFHDIILGTKNRNRVRKSPKKEVSFFKSLKAMYGEATLSSITAETEINETAQREISLLKVPIDQINLMKKRYGTGIHAISLFISSEIYFAHFINEIKFRALIPVGLKEGRKQGILGNYIGGTSLEVEKGRSTNLEKLNEIATSLYKKSGPEAYGAYLYFSKILRILPSVFSKKIARFESGKISAIVTSLNGPKALEENAFLSEYAIPALMPGQKIAFGFIKNKNYLDISIITDPGTYTKLAVLNESIASALKFCEINNWKFDN